MATGSQAPEELQRAPTSVISAANIGIAGLVNIHIAIENGPFIVDFSMKNGDFLVKQFANLKMAQSK